MGSIAGRSCLCRKLAVAGVLAVLLLFVACTGSQAFQLGKKQQQPSYLGPLVLEPDLTSYSLSSHVELLMDKEGTLSPQQAMSDELQDSYQPLNEVNTDLENVPTTFWARFTLSLDAISPPIRWTLLLNDDFFTSRQQEIFFRYKDFTGGMLQGRLEPDTMLPQAESTIVVIVPVPPPGTPITGSWTYFVRYSCIGGRIPHFTLVDTFEFLRQQQCRSLLYGLYYGFLLAVALVTLVFYIVNRERSLLYFLYWLLSVVVFFSIKNSTFDEILITFSFLQQSMVYSIASGLMLFFFTLFSRAFLMTSLYSKAADRMLSWYGYAALLLIPIPLFRNFELYFLLVQGLVLLSPFLCIGAGILTFKQGFKSARFFIVSLAAFPIGGALQMLSFMNYIPNTTLISHSTQIGAGTLTLLLSLALADRMRTLRQDKESAESGRRESEMRFRAIFNQTFQYIALIEPDGRILEINRTALEADNADKSQAIGKYIWDRPEIKGTEREKELRKSIQQAAKGRFVRFQQCVSRPLEKPQKHFDFSIKPVFNQLGDVTLLIAEARDISELKTAQERVFQSEKLSALGRIVAGVAHEINNPNNFIYFNIPVLREYLNAIAPVLEKWQEADGPLTIMNQPLEDYLNDMYQLLEDMELGSSRISSIVSELKNYLRSSENDAKKEMRIDEIIENVMTLAGNHVRKLVKSFEVEVGKELPLLRVHPARIEQVLINLLVNAGQAADKKDSWVKLVVEPADGDREGICIHIQDNGMGIAKELTDKVFEPFFTTKRGQTGTGQGLAISRSIIEDHGGELSLRSTPGEGSVFTVFLPTAHKTDDFQEETDR